MRAFGLLLLLGLGGETRGLRLSLGRGRSLRMVAAPPAKGAITPPAQGDKAAGGGAANAGGNIEAAPPLRQTPPKKVALLVEPTPFTHVSGYANRFKEMLRHLEAAGDKVEILTTDDDPAKPINSFGYPITYTKGFRFPFYQQIMLTLDMPDQIGAKIIAKLKPDVIHASSPGFLCGSALLYGWLYNRPLVLSYHTHLPVYARDYIGHMFPYAEELAWWILRQSHNRADLTLTTSPQIRDELVANGIERVEVWRKGIDTERFHPNFRTEAMRRRLTHGEVDAPLIVYIGRLGAEKKIQLLKGVLERFPSLRLGIVGKGPYEDQLKEHFAGTKTVFTGVLHGDELSEAFASADVFCMPSDSETLGFVVLESMASGVPVVGANAGGIPNLLDDGRTGFLFERNDVRGLGDALEKLLFGPGAKKRRDTMGQEARAEAEKWDWESATSVLRNVQYPLAVENHRKRRGVYGRFSRGWRVLLRFRWQMRWLLGTGKAVAHLDNGRNMEYQLGSGGWAQAPRRSLLRRL